MALRNLATRMRNPAAAALRLLPPASRVSAPAGARPRFYTSHQLGDQASSWPYTPEYRARKLLKENLALLEEVKQHHEYMRSNIWWMHKVTKLGCWTIKLLSPITVVAAVVKARFPNFM